MKKNTLVESFCKIMKTKSYISPNDYFTDIIKSNNLPFIRGTINLPMAFLISENKYGKYSLCFSTSDNCIRFNYLQHLDISYFIY